MIVADKIIISLTLLFGVQAAKIYGIRIDHTRRTVDELEYFEEFSVKLSNEAFIKLYNK